MVSGLTSVRIEIYSVMRRDQSAPDALTPRGSALGHLMSLGPRRGDPRLRPTLALTHRLEMVETRAQTTAKMHRTRERGLELFGRRRVRMGD